MAINKLTVLFVISTSRMNKKGLAPLACRITYLGKRKIFANGLFIAPNNWFSKEQQAKPPDKDENSYINSQLSLIKNKINQAFLLLQYSNETFDVEDIYLTYKGENIKKNKTLLELFELHNSKMLKLVGIQYARKYYLKFIETENTIKGFLKTTYNKNDFQLNKLSLKFLDDYDYYLKSRKKKLKKISINKNIQRLRRVIKLPTRKSHLLFNRWLLIWRM